MNHTDPHDWAGAQAQLHDAARAARQLADDRDTAPAWPLPPPSRPAVPGPRQEAPLLPAGQATRQQPRRPVSTLTARQLREYRRDLEYALTDLPGCAPVRGLLGRRLAAVLAGQDCRAQASGPPAAGPGQ
jgi:hypothetical protein